LFATVAGVEQSTTVVAQTVNVTAETLTEQFISSFSRTHNSAQNAQ
jgi:hypothetical protein